MSQTKAELIDAKGAVDLGALTVSGSAPNDSINVDSSGRLLVGVTSANANGGVLQLKSGITFPATAVDSTDVNTLDDYEEGTWTPGISVGSLTTAFGYYTKVGRVVFAAFSLKFPASASGTRIQVQDLPYANINPGAPSLPNFGYAVGYNNTNKNVGVHLNNNATNFDLYEIDGTDATYADFSTKDFRGVAIYFAS